MYTGDVIFDGKLQYLYDAEGRICAVQGPPPILGMQGPRTGYVYDAAGNRVARGSITTWSCDSSTNGFSQQAGYVVGPSGEQLTEVDKNNAWVHTNVYAAGKLIGTYDAAGLHFHIDDPLGTRRAQVSSAGALEAVYQSLPFGDGYASTRTVSDPTENHFTGKERDAESGNDYMFARYYNSAIGRFLSPDWSAKVEPVPYAKLDNPQSLNLYSYVWNNPLSRNDPDGHQCKDNDTKCEAKEAKKNERLTNVVYNELSSARPDPTKKPNEKGSSDNLAEARQAVAEVALRHLEKPSLGSVASPVLTDKANGSIKSFDPNAVDALIKSRMAADLALAGSNITDGATQYRTRVTGDVTTPVGKVNGNPGVPVTQSYGPFIEGKHTVVLVVGP